MTGRRIVAEPVELADVTPTLCDWFGLDGWEELSGRSLLPLVDSYRERAFASRPAVSTWRGSMASACDGRWRLVWNPGGSGGAPDGFGVPELQLFDVRRDPRERVDVAGAYPDVVAELQAAIRARLSGDSCVPLAEGF